MAVTTKQLKRVFRYEGTEIPDPAPAMPADDVLQILSASYPQLNNAALEGPSIENGKQVYVVKVATGTKG